jgi:hypothetical protein
MDKITDNQALTNDSCNELIQNLHGFDGYLLWRLTFFWWRDQKDKFQYFHFLEDKIFEDF